MQLLGDREPYPIAQSPTGNVGSGQRVAYHYSDKNHKYMNLQAKIPPTADNPEKSGNICRDGIIRQYEARMNPQGRN